MPAPEPTPAPEPKPLPDVPQPPAAAPNRRPLLLADEEPAPAPKRPAEEPQGPAPRAVEVDPDAGQRPPPWALVPGEDGLPDWPKGRGFPQDVGIWFVALPVDWMRRKTQGGAVLGQEIVLFPGTKPIRCRQVVLWELTIGDEVRALSRAHGDSNRAQHELAKKMIRAIDGMPADEARPTGPASVDQFWEDVGPRVRDLLMRLYASIHHLGEKERVDFFASCVALRTAVC